MAKIKVIIQINIFIAIILLLIPLFMAARNLTLNYQLNKGFSYVDETTARPFEHFQYQRMVPMHEMDLREFSWYLRVSILPVGFPEEWDFVVLEQDIPYYSWIDGEWVLAMEIPQGANIRWREFTFTPGYGTYSYPTYERGWRYARPFLPADQEAALLHELPYYYVRTSDLEAVAKTIYETHWESGLVHNTEFSKRLLNELVLRQTRRIDHIFYDRGIFNSPDLARPLWPWWYTLLLGCSGGLLFSSWLLQRRMRN